MKMEFLRKVLNGDKGNEINTLVQEIRQQCSAHFLQRYGLIQGIDTSSKPLPWNQIDTKVKILSQGSDEQCSQGLKPVRISSLDQLERLEPNAINQAAVLGLTAVKRYSKLIVFGQPGIGKTTFLQQIAIRCSNGDLQANLVPILMTVREFAEARQQPDLLNYISHQLSTLGIKDSCIIEHLLSQGKMLILLDGLDEVKQIDRDRVLQQVKNFTTQFDANQFVISCRNPLEACIFKRFFPVEVATFDDEQIASFAAGWFANKDLTTGHRFIQKLKSTSSIRELAGNPLLLNLLCLVFEESGDFPLIRSELYQEGLHILLKKWQTKHSVAGTQIYQKLLVHHKENLLSQIALLTFERNQYLIEKQEIQQYITDYICHFPDISTNPETLQLYSEDVLKAIATQHRLLIEQERGKYSFLHLMFHEYFTAREIIVNSHPATLDTALKQLASHVNDSRWHEVFILTVSMLRNPNYMLQLMKQKVDELMAQDEQLQAFLTWLSRKIRAVSVTYKPVSIRAFYFDLAVAHVQVGDGNLKLTKLLDYQFSPKQECSLALDQALNNALMLEQTIEQVFDPKGFEQMFQCAIAHADALEPLLGQALQQLKAQLPLSKDSKEFRRWWETNGKTWIEQLRSVMIQYRQIGHDWQFSAQQRAALKQYYYGNKLLIDCLNTGFYVTSKVRLEIEETLLLPTTEIPQFSINHY